jgi:hypothetical protein
MEQTIKMEARPMTSTPPMTNEPERLHWPSWHGPNPSESDHCPECIAFRRALAAERLAVVERIRTGIAALPKGALTGVRHRINTILEEAIKP